MINRPTFWTSHGRATGTMATNYFLHRRFFLADSGNVITIDKPCSVQDAQTTATIFGINGGPMMIGDDVDRMAGDRLALLKKCLPRLPECAKPIDLFDAQLFLQREDAARAPGDGRAEGAFLTSGTRTGWTDGKTSVGSASTSAAPSPCVSGCSRASTGSRQPVGGWDCPLASPSLQAAVPQCDPRVRLCRTGRTVGVSHCRKGRPR